MSAYFVSSRGLASRKLPRGTLSPIAQELFGAYEQGAMYDPEITGTLFQDSAFTVPVTAVEQPVGGILDLSGRGNHATQATTTKRPVLSRRVNMLQYTGVPIDEAWGSAPASVRYVEAPDGSITAVVPKPDASTDRWQFAINAGTYPNGTKLTYSFHKKTVPSSGISGQFLSLHSWVGLSVISTTESQPDSKGFTRVSVTLAVTDSAVQQLIRLYTTVIGADDIAVWGHQLDIGEVATTYQRIYSATDYDADPAKFPAYLSFDGVDDVMQTANIDFTGTDKMAVWAGVTKIGDAVRNPIIEVGGYGVAQGFGLYSSPQSTTNQMQAFHAAANPVYVYAAATPPNANYVLGLQSDLSAPKIAMRRSGVAVAESTASPGVGTYGNLPASIGAGASGFYFNGRLYSLIVRGAQTPLAQIEATELYVKQKMRMP